jgi:hypothetical protein
LPALELPTDKPRPAVQSYRSALLSFTVDAPLVAAMQSVARAEQCTMFAVMLSAYLALLHRYSGQGDLLVGVPMACRDKREFEEVCHSPVRT